MLNKEERLLNAVKKGNLLRVIAAVEEKANVSYRPKGYVGPIIQSACRSERHAFSIVKYLVEVGKADIDNKGEGYAPLLIASSAGNLQLVKYLLLQGADLNLKDGNGQTLLHHAMGLHEKVYNFLISQNINQAVSDDMGITAAELWEAQFKTRHFKRSTEGTNTTCCIDNRLIKRRT